MDNKKIEIKFEFTTPIDKEISYFSLGYFFFEKDDVILTNKNPDQCGMLLSSLPDLFDKIINLKNKNGRISVFNPIGSSYNIVFERKKNKLVIYEHSKEFIKCSFDEFALEIYSTYIAFMENHSIELYDLEGGSIDLVNSLISFSSEFNLNKST